MSPYCTAGNAQTFSEFLPTMQASLKQVFPSVQINPSLAIPIMRKGERISIPSNSNLVAIGLGWLYHSPAPPENVWIGVHD